MRVHKTHPIWKYCGAHNNKLNQQFLFRTIAHSELRIRKQEWNVLPMKMKTKFIFLLISRQHFIKIVNKSWFLIKHFIHGMSFEFCVYVENTCWTITKAPISSIMKPKFSSILGPYAYFEKFIICRDLFWRIMKLKKLSFSKMIISSTKVISCDIIDIKTKKLVTNLSSYVFKRTVSRCL